MMANIIIKVTIIEDLSSLGTDAMIIFAMREEMISFSTDAMIITTGEMIGITSTTTVTMTTGTVTMRRRLVPVPEPTRRHTRTRPPGGTSCQGMCTLWAY